MGLSKEMGLNFGVLVFLLTSTPFKGIYLGLFHQVTSMLFIHLKNSCIENRLAIAWHHPGYCDFIGEQTRQGCCCPHGAVV